MRVGAEEVTFDFELIEKYNTPAPRYKIYPPATQLRNDFTELDYRSAIAASNDRQSPLSLYFHLPFCQSACYFCGCNAIISNNQKIAEKYLLYLAKEMKNICQLIDTDRQVKQIHWGGGTPNYLSLAQVDFLAEQIDRNFRVDADAEISIEINPKYVDRNYIFFLKSLGFNRISFGIQDFNPIVQAAVNRVQPEKMIFEVMEWIREAGFASANVDLIYGLPFQTLSTFRETIGKTIELDPDRIAVFNFAYLPWLKPIQKNIPASALPKAHEKLEIWQMSIQELTHNGYVSIGTNRFAKLQDELAIAPREKSLKRNLQGYTTKPDTELFGFGATAISMLSDTYSQNHKKLSEYYQAIDRDCLPVSKGINLSRADILRRDIIRQIMSNFQLDKTEIEANYHIKFDDYFWPELHQLEYLEEDGLVKLSPHRIDVTAIGRLLVRNIAFVFDAHTTQTVGRFLSKAI